MENTYRRFFLMLVISFIIMYAVMFLNVDRSDHIYLSLTRLYMSLLMASPMALLMLVIMKKMYANRKKNVLIIVCSTAVFCLSLFFLRNQSFISDKQYMKAMIPHHSSALMTSKNADIRDPEVKKLSESIIESQEKEINQMKEMLKRLEDQ